MTTAQEPKPNKMRDNLLAQVGTISDNDANAVLIVRQKDGKINVNGYNLSTLLTVALMSEAEVMVIKNYLVAPDQLLPLPAPTPLPLPTPTPLPEPLPAPLPPVSLPEPVPAPETEWTPCGVEWETCTLPGKVLVRYGADGKYFEKVAEGSINCSNEEFGDPIQGVFKACSYRPLLEAITRTSNDGG
jgi:hypothetical protein